MTLRNWPASVIRKTPVTPSGSYDNSSASGVWTIDEAAYWESINQWPSQSNPSPDKFIENLFSTYLYTGNDSAQTITNGIDLSGKGGMVWRKRRTTSGADMVMDTLRGTNALQAYSASGQFGSSDSFTALNNGFSFNTANFINVSGNNYASWTFRKQPKFFDVVTWTGTGANPQVIPHNLGSVPGCIIVKATNATDGWGVYHRSLGNDYLVVLNTTAAQSGPTSGPWASTTPTSTQFTVGSYYNGVGTTFVAYLFAHDAGGFGASGTDNVISCGSFTTTSGGIVPEVNLGYEPQWVMVKRTDSTGAWFLLDTMRGYALTNTQYLYANDSIAEANWSTPYLGYPTATGFKGDVNSGIANGTFIYIAIRRGPMKVPTSGTSVFNALSRTGTAATATVSTTILPDLVISQARGGLYNVFYDRFRGAGATLSSTDGTGTDPESIVTNGITAFNNTSYTVSTDTSQNRINWNTYTYANWLFSRAPGFFDVVCATGNYNGLSTPGTPHNLGVKPEMVIQKGRNNSTTWNVVDWNPSLQKRLIMNTTAAADDISADLPQATSSVFYSYFNSTHNCVNYLFASCPGVSKVGTYTGTGTTKQIDCGFTSGARFVLIKRTDSTGDWYVWDSARGIVSGNDPYLLLNSPSAENTSTDYIDPYSAGFEISSTAPAAINANGGTYIFLAIA